MRTGTVNSVHVALVEILPDQQSAVGHFFFFSYVCHEPQLVSHKTVSSSAECSQDKPPFSFVRGQDLTM